MKFNLNAVILGICIACVCAAASAGADLTQEQRAKLAAAVMKEPLHSIDVTLCRSIIELPKTIEEIRKSVEDTFNRQEGPKENLTAEGLESRNRTVQFNVEIRMQALKHDCKSKQRIRMVGSKQRIDLKYLWRPPAEDAAEQGLPDTDALYYETSVNFGEHQNDCVGFAYYRERKNAYLEKRYKKMAQESEVIGFSSPWHFLQPSIAPDVDKLDMFIEQGELQDGIQIAISSEPNCFGTRERITIGKSGLPRNVVIVCDKEDYSKVYLIELFNPLNGKLLRTSRFDNYNPQGFPLSAEITKYETDGSLKNKEIYEIESVELNPALPNEIFKFRPPDDYSVLETDSNGIRYTHLSPEEEGMQKHIKAVDEKDVAALKELLLHQTWYVRLRSLKFLQHFLSQNDDELMAAAKIVENDENPDVRKQAREIIESVQSKKVLTE